MRCLIHLFEQAFKLPQGLCFRLKSQGRLFKEWRHCSYHSKIKEPYKIFFNSSFSISFEEAKSKFDFRRKRISILVT